MLLRNASFPGPVKSQATDKHPAERTRGEQLLVEIEAFLRRQGMKPSAFGQKACNNHALVERLQGGLDPQEVTCRRVRRFIELEEGRR